MENMSKIEKGGVMGVTKVALNTRKVVGWSA